MPKSMWALLLSQCKVDVTAQLVKNPPAMQETCVQSLGREDPLKKEMATQCMYGQDIREFGEKLGNGYGQTGNSGELLLLVPLGKPH